jgi:hypothetical protein
MPKKRYTPEEIVAKLRQVDVLVDLIDFLYQRHREVSAFVRSDLAVARMGSSSVALSVDNRAQSAV